LNNKFEFPITVSKGIVKEIPSDAIYSFVLESGHIMIINGIECVTLGHGFKGDVVEHDYFGT